MRKIVPILCILALSLSGCRATTLLRNGVDELRDYIASENAKTKKKLNDRRNEKISTLNRAISEKNEEIIFELMADDLREDGDKLKSQLKDFVNFIPGKIVETSNHSWGTLIQAENYKDAPDNVIEKKIWPHDDEGNYYCTSSKTCSACGHRLDALPLSVRSWDCPACGTHHDRDVNAAANILMEGKRILSNTEGTAGHAGTGAAVAA